MRIKRTTRCQTAAPASSRLLPLVALTLLSAACGSKEKALADEIARQSKATCDCLNSGDRLAELECEQRHLRTLKLIKDPEAAQQLKAAVDACRPAEQ